jgi:Nucleotidyltransferase of unknown function (DUF6036)
MEAARTIRLFDQFLAERGLSFEAVVIGGAALGLLGIISRQTRDCDILRPALPAEIRNAATAFAKARRAHGEVLDDEWLNNGPASLADALPEGWSTRLQMAYQGRAIILRCLGRTELLMSKLFALCDRGIDLRDCVALAPTVEELRDIRPWVERQDANPEWPAHVRATLDDLGRRLNHGV